MGGEKQILDQALEIESLEERSKFLDEACNGDAKLRAKVNALLRAYEDAGSFLEDPLVETIGQPSMESTGETIGPYKLLQTLGEGGMGIVYLAEQKDPVKRRVALKVIKQGMDSKQFIARFEAERQALAMMDHPNIAKVLDASCTETGRPYFVMELVKGVPITTFCDDNKLTTRERLQLFQQVCHGVQHAHQKGIIHRDLKPTNVLVALYDQEPVPKVIDFGVAKATNQQLTEKTLFTEVGSIVGTWEYMSPEQAVLNQLDVDTRSDVYSLGVLLYELLTGVTPHDRERLRTAQIMETLRIIREEEPPKPSTRISSMTATASSKAAVRHTKPESLVSEVRGDLDWIVMKALAKDRGRRYDSANHFAKDLDRYLRHDVIDARPPSALYQLQKLYARNKVIVSGLAVIILALLAGLTVALWGVREASIANQSLTKANNDALQQAKYAKSILKELWEVLADRALDATFSGDTKEANLAIDKAETAEAPQDLIRTLRGLTLFFDGKNKEAIAALENVVMEDPDSLTAVSALSWMYYHSTEYGKHEEAQDRARAVAGKHQSSRSVYEKFFVCLREGVEGTPKMIRQNLGRINAVIAEKRHWGVAYAIRARIQVDVAMDDKQIDKLAMAVADIDEARRILPKSPMVATLGLIVFLNATDLAIFRQDERAEIWKSKAQQLARMFGPNSTDALGIYCATVFHYRFGDPELAKELENELIKRAEPRRLMWTAEKRRYDKRRIPIQNWLDESANIETQVAVAISLAASNPTPQEAKQAREIVEGALATDPVAAFYTISMDVAHLLGDEQFARRIARLAAESGRLEDDWRWYRWPIEFYEGKITRDQLIQKAEPYNSTMMTAHYAIAMKALSRRDMPKARDHFRKVVKSGQVTTYLYHNAKAFLRKIESGSPWLKSLKDDAK